MSLSVFTLLILSHFISASDFQCPEGTVCPGCQDSAQDCYKNCPKTVDHRSVCCLHASQVLALASASTLAAAEVCATAHACANAATGVLVSATAVATAGAHVGFLQSVGLSVDAGTCCEINADIAANITLYASAFSNAVADVQAMANASAQASATAVAAAQAISEVLTQTQTLINGSCCGFSLEISNAVLIAGKFVAKANSIAESTVDVVTKSQAIAQACAVAHTQTQNSTSAFLAKTIDNCCVETRIKVRSSATINNYDQICQHFTKISNKTQVVYDQVLAFANDTELFDVYVNISNKICSIDCANNSFSCCKNLNASCCNGKVETCCTISKNAAKASLSAKAIALASSDAVAYAKTYTSAVSDASSSAHTAIKGVAQVSLGINIKVRSCCSIDIHIQTSASGRGKAISNAIAKAKGVAKSHSNSYAYAQGVAKAISSAVTTAAAFATIFNTNCCGKACCNSINYYYQNPSNDCCSTSRYIAQAFNSSHHLNCASATKKAIECSKSETKGLKLMKDTDVEKVCRRSRNMTAYHLQCCCCDTNKYLPARFANRAEDDRKGERKNERKDTARKEAKKPNRRY